MEIFLKPWNLFYENEGLHLNLSILKTLKIYEKETLKF